MKTVAKNISIFAKKWYVMETTFFLALTLIIPALVHLIPTTDGVPIGARFLPIFYAPFVATMLFRYPVGLFIALAAPSINYLLFGKPALPIVGVLTLELTIFVSLVTLLSKVKELRLGLAAIGYIITKLFSTTLIAIFPQIVAMKAQNFIFQSLSNAWAGLIVLVILSIVIDKYKSKINVG